MPLCPQVTITPITVTSTNMVQTSVIAANVPATTEQLTVVDTTAAAAQAAAATAQAEAATAFATAVAANTAASTAQATADGKNKVTYSTTTPGATPNTLGDIWFQYGTTGVNNGRIIAQYTGNGGTTWTQTTISGLVVANLDAGSITTGTLSVALGITGTSGNFSVNAVTGALVASSATITGAVNAISGYFGSPTNGYSISATGLTGIGTGAITGGTIQTSSGNQAVILNGAANAIQFKAAGSVVANLLPLTSGGAAFGLLMHYGATPDPDGGTRPQIFIGSGNVSLSASAGNAIGISNSIGITMSGTVQALDSFFVKDSSISTAAPNGRIDSDGRVRRTTGSSIRFKDSVVDLSTVAEMLPSKLLELPVRAFKFKADYLDSLDNRVDSIVPGFIAEEVDNFYPSAADYDIEGNPENWNERFIIPGMLALIQDLYKEIKLLKGE